MGLAGTKNRQKIGLDPNNKTWADDKSKFGFKLLSKMGWEQGKGLGAKSDGISEHVKVSYKKDTLGVGADKRTIDNWLDNTSAFDALLKNLNDNLETNKTEDIENVTVFEKCGVAVEEKVEKLVSNGRLSHRKKWLRNKSVSNFDSKALSMILGERPTFVEKQCDVKETNKEELIVEVLEKKSLEKQDGNNIVKNINMQDYFKSMMSKKYITPPLESSGTEDEVEENNLCRGLGLGYSEKQVLVEKIEPPFANNSTVAFNKSEEEPKKIFKESKEEKKKLKKLKKQKKREKELQIEELEKVKKSQKKKEKSKKESNSDDTPIIEVLKKKSNKKRKMEETDIEVGEDVSTKKKSSKKSSKKSKRN
ncbi:hypothetical protein HK099_008517 [Clydaea vesicula]|uniref:G-patch domain-containing protein n=1 Tax=Clydaea vesicula TaxID=447962 RepID=A0AAD5XVT8_9FUNG|nr:hypothetical protein HK099_008517 [Clydaea vesicula]